LLAVIAAALVVAIAVLVTSDEDGPDTEPTETATGGPSLDLPSEFPTGLLPSDFPTELPSGFPTALPSDFPSGLPTALPSGLESLLPGLDGVDAP
jgi:hypothetical protein